jgi:branched-subunit amino acid transport protein
VSELIAVLVVGLGSYLFRSFFILALAHRRIPDQVLVALNFVAPAVLASLIVALMADSAGDVAIGVPEATALLAGGVVAQRTRNHIWTLFAGMAVYWVVRALL